MAKPSERFHGLNNEVFIWIGTKQTTILRERSVMQARGKNAENFGIIGTK